VNIRQCRIRAFGRLRDLVSDFSDGLNLIFAANEGGKSTLQRFLIGMLYGQLRADNKSRRFLDSWVDQYKPWQGADYGGAICCRLADGREVEIRRAFGKDENGIEILTAGGEEISGQYERQRNGEVLFAQQHLGLPKELFESVAVIR